MAQSSKELLGRLVRRVWKGAPSRRALRRKLLGTIPSVVKAGDRAVVSKVRICGRDYFKKKFRDTKIGRSCFECEMLAERLFSGRPWKVPIVAAGDLWIASPVFPQESRLDVLAPELNMPTKLEIARQSVWLAFEIFLEGYAHRDFHSKNLFFVDSQLILIDFEEMGQYPKGQRPPFPNSFDLCGEGMDDSPWGGKVMHYGATTQSKTSLQEVLEVPLEHLLEEVKREFNRRLADVAQTFRSAKARRNRHTCVEECIYSSFSLPHFGVAKEETQRDSSRRLQVFGVTRETLYQKTLLDLGSHSGAMIFESQKFAPRYCVGVEYDAEKVDITSKIAAYCGLNNVRFLQGNIDELSPEQLGGKFDVVFCLAVEAHLKKKRNLYNLLSDVTGEVLYFEGNSTTNADLASKLLLESGFRDVKTAGFSDDDERKPRPLLVARK